MKSKRKLPKFWFSASLRIHDVPEYHEQITARLGLPSECHKKGDPKSPPGKHPWPNDIWMRNSPLPERRDIAEHLAWVSNFARPHLRYLRHLIRRGARIDVYMSYSCDHEHCGFGLAPKHLAIFTRLGIRMEVSIMTHFLAD
ncbi:MAG: DUF4279 domain-containing protein [Verrucomicrobiia bacterium]